MELTWDEKKNDQHTHPSHVETRVSCARRFFNANANSDIMCEEERNFRLSGKRGTGQPVKVSCQNEDTPGSHPQL
jgi:hypothetical protein